MPIVQPGNSLVLAALSSRAEGKAEIARHDAIPAAQAYMHCGCHPDVVERLWDQLGAALPQDSRCLIYGTPALVHPCGLNLAVGMGTSYGLRILPSMSKAAAEAGAKTITTWSGGGGMDICQDYGTDWIFGSWSALEQGAAAGDLDATFQLFQVLLNAAFKQHSQPLLDRAGSLLSTAAAGGHPQAVAMVVAWPRLKAEAERKIPKSDQA
jgi:hypothetical protein